MALAFLATIAAQMGSAWYNCHRSKSQSKKLAELQQKYEKKVTLEGIENARFEFAELCAQQREIEKQSQLDRLALIRNNHEQSLLEIAYSDSLQKWPLLVPPYVIANAPLTIGSTAVQNIPLNCILTTSSDLAFNNNVFHKLEEQVALFCAKHWNGATNKSIRFFQESWRDDAKDVGSRHKDIYAHLKNVPILLISPVLKNDTILFRFYWWGLSIDPTDAHINDINELNPELSISVKPKMKYDEDTINHIVKECTPKLKAFISFFADMYYWNFYKASPSLPKFLASDHIHLPDKDLEGYRTQYTQQLIDLIEHDNYLSGNTPDNVSKLIFAVSHIADAGEINKCIRKYINKQRSSESLTSYHLNSLSSLTVIKNLSKATMTEIDSAISYILENEEIGYFPCIGRNDLLQTILNQKNYIPSANKAVMNPITDKCSIIQFLNNEDKIAVGPMGYRTFFATHPEFRLTGDKEFSLISHKLNTSDKNLASPEDISISDEEIQTLLASQLNFINSLKNSYIQLKAEFWDDKLELTDLSYSSIPSIIKQINSDGTSADKCLIIVGYSQELDNYTYCIVLMRENQYVGDRFVCRSNSLDKTIRNKLNNKTVLKINLK